MQGYSETILKYATNETHVGLLETPDGTGEVGLTGQNAGNRLAVRFTLNLEDQQVKDVRFQVFGCGYTIAACAAAAELSAGHSLRDVQHCTPKLIDNHLGGLPDERRYCAELANQALQSAIISAQNGATPVAAELRPEQGAEHRSRLDRNDPVYRALLETPVPPEISSEDRRMFAGLLTLALHEKGSIAAFLGLRVSEIKHILAVYFPGCAPELIAKFKQTTDSPALESNQDVLALLLAHVVRDQSVKRTDISELLAKTIAARSAQPGHLWVAMGFIERPQLTAAIRRHLPTLAIANSKGMRWKRYLFKQICNMNGGVMCQTPNCNDCSDYGQCFATE